MAEADIRLLIGAKGGSVVNGQSGKLIREQLEAQLVKGIQVKVGIDEPNTIKALQAQLDRVSAGLKITIGADAAAQSDAVAKETAEVTANTAAKKHNANAAATQAAAQAKNNVSTERSAKVTAQATAALANLNAKFQNIKPSALKIYASEIQEVKKLLLESINTGDPQVFAQAQNGIKMLNAGFKSLGAEGGNVFTYLEGKIKTFSVYLMSSAMTMGFVGGFKDAVSAVKDLNEAMTDLRIITGGNNAQAKELLRTYNAMAQELGSTTVDIAGGAQDWLRQGYSQNDTNELLRQSMSLSIMGDMASAEATTALTAALKGYRLEVSQASDVVDKFFAVDMAAATSSSKLAEALAKTAANAKLAGLDLNDVIGQLAVVNETMQENGESTGTFYNTMLSRMGRIKSGVMEDPESGDDLSDVETTLNALDIKLRSSNSEFRNFGDVLDEVAGKWDSFSSVQQRAVATAFAGTRQQTRFISLMAGYEQAAKYAETAADSIGISAQKMGIYQESLEAKANRMTAAFERMSATLISDDLIGQLYDKGADVFNALSRFDAIPVKIAAPIAAILTLNGALGALAKSHFGESVGDTIKGIGWPKTTGDKCWYILPSHSKEAA